MELEILNAIDVLDCLKASKTKAFPTLSENLNSLFRSIKASNTFQRTKMFKRRRICCLLSVLKGKTRHGKEKELERKYNGYLSNHGACLGESYRASKKELDVVCFNKHREKWSKAKIRSLSSSPEDSNYCSQCKSVFNKKSFPKAKGSAPEKEICEILSRLLIDYEQEWCLPDNKRFDFYIPEYNMFLEYDGEQHFMLVNRYPKEDTEELLSLRQRLDLFKMQWALRNNYRVARIDFSFRDSLGKEVIKALRSKDNVYYSSDIYKSKHILGNTIQQRGKWRFL